MDKQLFFSVTKQVFDGLTEINAVHLPAENVTLPILDAPIIGFAAADDPGCFMSGSSALLWAGSPESPQAVASLPLFSPFLRPATGSSRTPAVRQITRGRKPFTGLRPLVVSFPDP